MGPVARRATTRIPIYYVDICDIFVFFSSLFATEHLSRLDDIYTVIMAWRCLNMRFHSPKTVWMSTCEIETRTKRKPRFVCSRSNLICLEKSIDLVAVDSVGISSKDGHVTLDPVVGRPRASQDCECQKRQHEKKEKSLRVVNTLSFGPTCSIRCRKRIHGAPLLQLCVLPL